MILYIIKLFFLVFFFFTQWQTVLNAGDSRLMLGVRDARTGKVVPREVTIDNKPDDPKEQARIEAHGGRVWAMKYDDGVDGEFYTN